jgi:lysophospholipase L1-like esterase
LAKREILVSSIQRAIPAIAVASVFTIATFLATVLGTGGFAGAATPTTAFYLDLGASQSVGVQPVTSHHGQPTNRGYANYLVALEAAKGVTLQLTQLGCPGESTTTMMVGKDRCYRSLDSQLSDAVAFLRAHQGQTGLVTVELGFNNVARCLGSPALAGACVVRQIGNVSQQLPRILNALKAAAGPNVTIVGLGHADPFLANALGGPAGTASAAQSLKAMQQLNSALANIYATNSIPMVNVAAAFKMTVTSQTVLAGVGTVPLNVAQACLLTWMCQPAPLGPNLHPNDAGYQVIASAIAAVLPAAL